MRISHTEFKTSAAGLDDSPAWGLPEFAFIGRSNVGKSSLLNQLAGRGGALARVSATPGATQLLNFYVFNREWCLVDLPGYGYSKVKQSVRDGFREAVSGYLAGRENLRCVFQLLDARHPPQRLDVEFAHWLGVNGIPFVLVFTKIDKVKINQAREHALQFQEALADVCDGEARVFLTSAVTGAGRAELLDFIGQALRV